MWVPCGYWYVTSPLVQIYYILSQQHTQCRFMSNWLFSEFYLSSLSDLWHHALSHLLIISSGPSTASAHTANSINYACQLISANVLSIKLWIIGKITLRRSKDTGYDERSWISIRLKSCFIYISVGNSGNIITQQANRGKVKSVRQVDQRISSVVVFIR